MKGLLQSKRFRTNLYKWLFMYAGVMMLLITVITYSKFITSMSTKDTARTTKFNIDINYLNCNDDCGENCDEKNSYITSNNICKTENYRPTSTIEYAFNVKKDVEVKTILALNIDINNDLKVYNLKIGQNKFKLNYDENNKITGLTLGTKENAVTYAAVYDQNLKKDVVALPNGEKLIITDPHSFTISETINPNIIETTNYIVYVKYNGDDVNLDDDEKFREPFLYSDAIKVGYSAKQTIK